MTAVPSEATRALAAECQVLTRYLTGTDATPYVVDKYQAGHASLHAACGPSPTWFDGVLLALARHGPYGPRLVDNYTRWFSPRSVVRHKFALLLAVLEFSPEFHRPVTSAKIGARWALIGGLMLAGLLEAAVLLMSVIVLGPLHVYALTTRSRH